MKLFVKWAAVLAVMAILGTSFLGMTAYAASDIPAQVTAHFGGDASTEVNIVFTTQSQAPSKVTYYPAENRDATQTAEGAQTRQAGKYFHKVALSGLQPGTQYVYAIGEGDDAFQGKFKTAPAKGSKDAFTFAYLADTQVSTAEDAKALGANLQQVADGGYDFVYLAGDHTDTATNETQWEQLFTNDGAYPTGGQNLFGGFAVAVVQGNHDNADLSNHFAVPAQAGKAVYAFDYGPATFIMLNLESTVLLPTERNKQADFLRNTAKDAKSRGQWVIVGFHKSIYSGASHIADTDVVAARKFWSPVLAEADVDLVLQGHDHVYSRGFIRADGSKAINASNGAKVQNPENAPLYMVAGHAGGLKWYSQEAYKVNVGDPLIPDYAFLDRNSTDDKSDEKKEQWIVGFRVSDDKIIITTKASKYDVNTDKLSTPSYVYDTLTITRTAVDDGLSIPNTGGGSLAVLFLALFALLTLIAVGCVFAGCFVLEKAAEHLDD